MVAAAHALDIPCAEQYKEIRLGKKAVALVEGCGRRAFEKGLPVLDYDLETVRLIVEAMEAGDGGLSSTSETMVYSTISPTLVLQYRIMQRMLGRSVHIRRVDEHGGFGTHPIYRATVRRDHKQRPWARIRSIHDGGEGQCYDIETASGKIYLPESDIVVHNCDDSTIVLGSMLQSVGYPVRMRVIRTKDSSEWNHIYLLVQVPPSGTNGKWMALDASVDRPAGWQAPQSMVAAKRDFPV